LDSYSEEGLKSHIDMKEIKHLLIADIHLSSKDEEVKFSILEQAIRMSRDLGAFVTILGDLFDKRVAVETEIIRRAQNIFVANEKYLHIVVGNHDKVNEQDDSEDSPSILENISRLHIVPACDVHNKIGYISYTANEETLRERIKLVLKEGARILMTHNDFRGFEMNSGVRSEKGYSRSLVKKFDRVYTGHFHKPSQMGNITYIGNQYHCSFSDAGQKKRGVLITVRDGKVVEEELVKFKFPKFKKVIMEANKSTKEIKDRILKAKEKSENVQVVLKGKREDLIHIDYEELKCEGVQVSVKPQKESPDDIPESSGDDLGIFENYCLSKRINDHLSGVGMKLLTKARSDL